MRILVIEDDLEAQRYLVQGLKESGHVVDEAADGETGLSLALSRPYDVAIVDRMLPKLDGLKVVAEMREHSNSTPVLFLSALSEVDDRVKGLKAGGDDYLTKPYAFVELLARVDALMRRRSPVGVKTRLDVGDLELDLLSRAAKRSGTDIESAAARIPPAGISHAPCRPGGDPHHAAGKRVGVSLRSPDQCDRRPYQPAARQDRQGFRGPVAAHRARRRLHDPCALSAVHYQGSPPAFCYGPRLSASFLSMCCCSPFR